VSTTALAPVVPSPVTRHDRTVPTVLDAAREVIARTDRIRGVLTQVESTLTAGLAPLLTAFPASAASRAAAEDAERALLDRHFPDVARVLDTVYADLTALDGQLSPADRWACRRYHRIALQGFFMQAPIIRRVFDQPLGYPGDYGVVEMLFDGQDGAVSPLGKLLARYTFAVGPSRAHRGRVPWAVGHLHRLHRGAGRPLRVLSVACGPERVLRQFVAEGGRCAMTLCDVDRRALDVCRRQFAKLGPRLDAPGAVEYVELSPHRLIKDAGAAAALRPGGGADGYDVILVLGLLDYLRSAEVARFLDVMVDLLATGGQLLLTNVHAVNPWRAYMEYVGNWNVVHRDVPSFQAMAVGEPARLRPVELTLDETGTNIYFLGTRDRAT
jgi:extracellular factor (EF) 3-hydroxypalmitic acid methyl ester biosynthesis protein